MKQGCLLLCLMIFLTGCGKTRLLETVNDGALPEPSAEAMQILVDLPGSMEKPVLESESGALYLGDGYALSLQTRPAGDLDGTVRELTGFDADRLQIWQSPSPEGTCYRCSWTSAGEGGSQVGRLCILDDGAWQYALCVMAPEALSGDLDQSQWREIFSSFRLAKPGTVDLSGS